jgi:hypothetical protein
VTPVHADARSGRQVVARVRDVQALQELVVVDDCARAATPALLEAWPAHDTLMVRHADNRGNGTGLEYGFAATSGGIAIFANPLSHSRAAAVAARLGQ